MWTCAHPDSFVHKSHGITGAFFASSSLFKKVVAKPLQVLVLCGRWTFKSDEESWSFCGWGMTQTSQKVRGGQFELAKVTWIIWWTRGEYIRGIPWSDLSDLLCDFKMGDKLAAWWYQFKSDQSHFILEIFDFFGGFSKEAHSFQQLLCVGSLLDALQPCIWKDPVANSFGGTDHQHFLYRTAVRNGRSYPAKRRRTSAFCGVFRPWTWADLSVEGRRNLIYMLMIRWFIDWCLSNQYICQEHREFFDTTLPILLFFSRPQMWWSSIETCCFCQIMQGLG